MAIIVIVVLLKLLFIWILDNLLRLPYFFLHYNVFAILVRLIRSESSLYGHPRSRPLRRELPALSYGLNNDVLSFRLRITTVNLNTGIVVTVLRIIVVLDPMRGSFLRDLIIILQSLNLNWVPLGLRKPMDWGIMNSSYFFWWSRYNVHVFKTLNIIMRFL